MQMRFFFFLAILATGLSACSPRLSPFTDNLYRNSGWSERDLRKIQFYVSRDIVLQRKIDDTKGSVIEGGRIRVIKGSSFEEIVIRSGTPGAFLFSPDGKRLAISFENGKDPRFLMFGPHEKRDGAYVLLASDWDKDTGAVTYGETSYVTPAASAYATLMVDSRQEGRTTFKVRNAPGRRVD